MSVAVAAGSAAGWWLFTGFRPLPDRMDLGHNVTLLTDGFVSVMVMDTNDGVLLIDTGHDPGATEITRYIAELGYTPADVHTILLTHDHDDHIGGVGAFPSATVMGMQPCRVDLDRKLEPIDVIRHGTLDVEAYAVPGHTPGSAAYVIQGIVALGDAADVRDDGALAGARWGVSDDLDGNLRSLATLADHLRRREVRWLAPSHSGPVQGPHALFALIE